MSFLFPSKSVSIPPAVAAPTVDDSAVKEAAQAETDKIKKRRGMASTIATSAEGLTSTPTTLKTTLG
jgi:hypothetical protein